MAQRYSKLPSQLLSEGDTFDLMVFDVATTYQQLQNDKNSNQGMPIRAYDQSQLEEKMKKVRK